MSLVGDNLLESLDRSGFPTPNGRCSTSPSVASCPLKISLFTIREHNMTTSSSDDNGVLQGGVPCDESPLS